MAMFNKNIGSNMDASLLHSFVPFYNTYKGLLEFNSKYTVSTGIRLSARLKTHLLLKAIKDLGLYDFSIMEDYHSGCFSQIFCRTNEQYFNIMSDGSKFLTVYVIANDVGPARDILKRIVDALKPYHHEEETKVESPYVNLDFYQMMNGSPYLNSQKLLCPKWSEIKGNYASKVLEGMENLINNKAPWLNGRLIILYGPPGCGKTYFIRSLVRAYRNLMVSTVVIDPEELSRNPMYYFDISGDISETALETNDGKLVTNEEAKKKPRLIIMEDCADLILTESRTAHYDKVGKLLNMTDGLLGQGRNDVFLISFNEDINEIDPAFMRPGRLLVSIEVPKLSYEDSSLWLKNKGYNQELPKAQYSLAELYSKIEDKSKKVISSSHKLGFK